MTVAHDAHRALESGRRFEYGGDPARALRAYRTAVALADAPAVRAEAVRRVGDAHRAHGAWASALESYQESVAIARAHGLADLTAEALSAEGTVAVLRGDLVAARQRFGEALSCNPGARVRGLVLTNLGLCAARDGEHARAVELFVSSLDCYREASYARGVLMALNNVAAAHIETGDPAAAMPLLREAAHMARRDMELDLLLLTVRNEAEACLKLGNLADAEERIGEALGHFTHAGAEARQGECLVILGDVLRAYRTPGGDHGARRCYERAVELAEMVDAGHVAARARAALAAL